eukprot:1140759-Pelagomonas_calceolata.AAC.2
MKGDKTISFGQPAKLTMDGHGLAYAVIEQNPNETNILQPIRTSSFAQRAAANFQLAHMYSVLATQRLQALKNFP